MYVSSNIEIQRHIGRHCKAVLPHIFPDSWHLEGQNAQLPCRFGVAHDPVLT